MKLEINIDEAKILELAQTTTIEELPRQIYYQAKEAAIERAVTEIKNKLVERPYFSNTERLNREVSEKLFENISEQIQSLIEKSFNEDKLQSFIESRTEKILTEWLEKKIYAKLEALKKDIFIASYGELQAEREYMEQAHQDEVNAILENQ